MTKLEKMAAFFEARLDGYEKQMTENVQGCREAGFAAVTQVMRIGGTAVLVAHK